MSAKTCQSMDEIRAEIDRLDAELVPLLSERAEYVRQAALFKPTRADVVVPDRIEAIVGKVRRQAESLGGDPDLLEALYRHMIATFIAFEERHWDRVNADE